MTPAHQRVVSFTGAGVDAPGYSNPPHWLAPHDFGRQRQLLAIQSGSSETHKRLLFGLSAFGGFA
jgi:hypothetical protein